MNDHPTVVIPRTGGAAPPVVIQLRTYAPKPLPIVLNSGGSHPVLFTVCLFMYVFIHFYRQATVWGMTSDFETITDRSELKNDAGCTKNQLWRPILGPFRATSISGGGPAREPFGCSGFRRHFDAKSVGVGDRPGSPAGAQDFGVILDAKSRRKKPCA